jgi:hypothetical protein
MDRYGFARSGGGPLVRGKRFCGWLHERTAVHASTSSGRLPLVESDHPRTQGWRRERNLSDRRKWAERDPRRPRAAWSPEISRMDSRLGDSSMPFAPQESALGSIRGAVV